MPFEVQAYNNQVGQVYLLHFLGEGLAHGRQANVRHYLGWAENAEARIERHMRGTSGARLMEVVKERRIAFTVARVWDGVTREFERRLKNQGGLSRHCPVCRAEGTDRYSLEKKRRQQKTMEVPAAPATPGFGPDYAEVEIGSQAMPPRQASFSVMAYDYGAMFKKLLDDMGRVSGSDISAWKEEQLKPELEWAKAVLKRRDRITWYLRLLRMDWADEFSAQEESFRNVKSMKEDPGFVDDIKENLVIWKNWKQFVSKEAARFGMDPNWHKSQYANAEDCLPRVVRNELDHYLSLHVPEIDNLVFENQAPSMISYLFQQEEAKWREQNSRLLAPRKGDRAVIDFGNGWAWWVLDRSSCPDEAAAMGHCGNRATGPGRPDDRILSLRRKVIMGKDTFWEPHLTFILDDEGLLGEMKGRGNEKPTPKYHPYIVSLLQRTDLVRGMRGGGYWPEHNFDLDDLPKDQRDGVVKGNRNLLSASDLFSESRGNMTPELLKRIAGRTALKKDEWNPGMEAFVVDQYPNPEEFIRFKGNNWLKQQMKIARYGFTDSVNDDAVKEGIIDLLTILTPDERQELMDYKTPYVPSSTIRPAINALMAVGTPENLYGVLVGRKLDEIYTSGTKFRDIWEMLRKAWEAGLTDGTKEFVLGNVKEFLGSGYSVRTTGLSNVVMPSKDDPGFWNKEVLVTIDVGDAITLADSTGDEGPTYDEDGDDISISSYWESNHDTTSFDASKPYKEFRPLAEITREIDKYRHEVEPAGGPSLAAMEEMYRKNPSSAPIPYPTVDRWYQDFRRGRPYELLKWVRSRLPGAADYDDTPGAWNERKAKQALFGMLREGQPGK